MNQKEWQKTLQSWQVKRKESTLYAEPSTSEELDAFKQEFDLRLPPSYRAFASVVGPGTLADLFRIETPVNGRSNLDLTDSHRSNQGGWPGYFDFTDPSEASTEVQRMVRIVWFSSTFRGDMFGWDPEDSTAGTGGECGIYLHRRTGPSDATEEIASTFDEFIFEFCLGPKYYEFFPHDSTDPKDEDYPFSQPRESYSLSLHRTPPSQSVNLPEPTGIVSSPEYWKQLRASLEVKNVDKPLGPPSEQAISEYEQAIGLVLPQGYREFLSEFGPGLLGRRYHITAPGNPDRGYWVDLAECNSDFQEGEYYEAEDCDDPELVRRLVPFCSKEDRDYQGYIAWDPRDVRNSEDHEYAIYDASGPTFLAASFVDFIENVALSDYWEQRYGSRGVAGPHREFLPVPAEE
ncbi:MAG: SMI1/KNR4 family protein [Planctomycetaceae bacterium]|nr:SMI1/KNR4 family protein [Planctomycetaceae bacterium]